MSWRDDFHEILTAGRELRDLTTYRIGGRARWFFAPRDAAETARLVAAFTADRVAFRVLGGGANLLVDDADHEIPIVHLGRLQELEVDGGHVRVGAGFGFPRLVAETTARGLAGCEGLAGIPGHVGGACAMNAGGRWGEFGDTIARVELASTSGEVIVLDHAEVGFAYRQTSLPPGIVTAVELGLEPVADPKPLRARKAEVLRAKGRSQPLTVPSGGCIFANPEGGSAGRLVEELGLKGMREGGARISEIHGNFIVNEGAARFGDVVALIERIEASVREQRGIALRREIKIWPADAARTTT